MSAISNKWEKTGLLEGLKEHQKEGCSEHLEKMAKFLIQSDDRKENLYNDSFCGMIIPIVRRLYPLLNGNVPDTQWLCYDFASHIKKSKLKREDHYTGMDYEAELCAEYTDELVKRLEESKERKPSVTRPIT